jgi:hypothetical protein
MTHLQLPSMQVEQFVTMLHFHQRKRLAELQIDIHMGIEDERFLPHNGSVSPSSIQEIGYDRSIVRR